MRLIYYIWIIAMLIALLLFGNLAAAITQHMSSSPRRVFWIGTGLYALSGYLLPFAGYRLGLVSEVFATWCIFGATVSAILFPFIQLLINAIIKTKDT